MGKMYENPPPKPSTSSTQNANEPPSNNHLEVVNNLTSTSSEFQIITPPSTSPPVNGTYNNQFTDLQLSVYSAPFDLSPDEIHSRLRELVRENLELKDTIHENNVAMNEQCDRLSAWQDEVKMVHRQHKSKFEETRNVIQRLHAQNMELQEKLQQEIDSKQANESNAEEIDTLRKQLLERNTEIENLRKENERLTILELQLKEELNSMADNLERIKVNRSRLIVEKKDLVAMNNDLQSQLAVTKQSSMQTSVVEPTSSMTNESLQQGYVVVQPQFSSKRADVESSSPLDSQGIKQLLQQLQAQEQVHALMEELMEERKAKALVQKELSNLKQSVGSGSLTRLPKPEELSVHVPSTVPVSSAIMSSPPFEQSASMMHGLKQSESKFNAASEHLQRYKERCNGLETRLSDYHDRLESLQMKDDSLIQQLHLEIADLRRTLAREQAANQQDKASLTEARCQFETLLRDYQELLRSWESYEKDQANKMPGMQSVAYYEIQLKGLKEQIDSLTAQLVASEETVAAKMDETNRIRQQLRAGMDEMEKIPILQAQVEVYQADFRTEREAREKLHQEKEQALRALHDLQNRYQQLNDEMRLFRQSNLRPVSRSGSTYFRQGAMNEAAGYRFDAGEANHVGGSVPRQHSAGEDRRQRVESAIVQNGTNVTMLSTVSKMQTPLRNPNTYLCPKCNLGFKDLQPLENHVNFCLDNDDPFL